MVVIGESAVVVSGSIVSIDESDASVSVTLIVTISTQYNNMLEFVVV